MSPATSIAKPLARPTTQCPYCDHVSPADTKFCSECGAALHLVPCPHCGAVNDITIATACYRCHGELRKNESAPLASTTSPATPPATATPRQAQELPYVIVEPPARQRPHALVVAIVLVAFAAASYYAYQQRSALSARETVRSDVKPRGTATDSNANAGAGSIVKAPADSVPNPAADKSIAAGAAVPLEVKVGRPDAEPRENATAPAPIATTATRSNVGRSGAGREAAGSPFPTLIVAPDSARARIEASKGLEKQTPNIGPCTDAVAALGLCTPEPTPRRQ